MMASCQLDEPRVITAYKLQADRKALGVTFKGDQKKVLCRCYLRRPIYVVVYPP